MNASVTSLEELGMDYGQTFRTKSSAARTHDTSRRPKYGRLKGSEPKKFNGIHRRRRKKINW
jgi:hypothetical protein